MQTNTPQIRFKGFTEPWEIRKLGEVCQITMGQSPDGSTFESINSDAVNNAKICIPSNLAEQTKIGEYFANLDRLIMLHDKKYKS